MSCQLFVFGWICLAILGAAAAYEFKTLEDHQLLRINDVADPEHLKEAVKNILIPRVVGTEGHTQVKNYLKLSLVELGWTVQTDRFDEKTPNQGVLTFENIFALSNPDAKQFLLIAAHYDSKYFANEEFLGATDSAVPCAMILNLAKTLQGPLETLRARTDLGLLLVFFDGEEAFQNWSPTDSIYGARHLAQRWENEGFLPRIRLFFLLDLLGASDPTFYSYFQKTQEEYKNLMSAEDRLLNAGFMGQYQYSGVADRKITTYFQPQTIGMGIEDDHIPFLRRNVPILHMIPTPFPSVWHKITDDSQAIDYVAVENLNRIIRLFVIEYLQVLI